MTFTIDPRFIPPAAVTPAPVSPVIKAHESGVTFYARLAAVMGGVFASLGYFWDCLGVCAAWLGMVA